MVASPFESLICRYYSLEVSYFKSSLDRKLLEMLWNKYWVNTLSSSSLLTVSNKLHKSLFIPCHNTANQNTGKWLYIRRYLTIVLANVFSVAWYKNVSLCAKLSRGIHVLMEYPTCHKYRYICLLAIHTSLKAHVYTKKIQVTRGIFHNILLKSIA